MVGKMLRFMRKSRNYNQVKISEQINFARNTISQYETGALKTSFETLEKIANNCGYKIYFEDSITKQKYEVKDIDRKDI